MKVLTIDLESAPHTAHVWGLFDQTIGLSQLLEAGYILCIAAKWEHEDRVRFHKGPTMLREVHKLLDQADVVIGFNHVRFDLPHIQREFMLAGMTPPSPYMNVDLLSVVRRQFKLASNKLAYVGPTILGEDKAPTGGHQLWIDVMKGDRGAWQRMRHYCEQDVLLTERLFHHLKPWINVLPIPNLYGDGEPGEVTCPQCGSNDMQSRGLAYTKLCAYQRYHCKACRRWSRGKHRVHGTDAR